MEDSNISYSRLRRIQNKPQRVSVQDERSKKLRKGNEKTVTKEQKVRKIN